MTICNRRQAVRRARASVSNIPGTCQLWTRTIFGADSAGDRDGDGDADAVDGWNSEPVSARHPGDRTPPPGVPLAFAGGSRGFGHRAVSLPNGKVRSTDMTETGYAAGRVGTTTISQIERSMGVTYLGWSETISGQKIPLAPKKKPAPAPAKVAVKTSRGKVIDEAIKKLTTAAKRSKDGTKRRAQIEKAIAELKKITPTR